VIKRYFFPILIFIYISLTGINPGFSQSLTLLPDSGGRWKDVLKICWIDEVSRMEEFLYDYHDVRSEGDTIINDKSYFKISENGFYAGGLRQDSCKVYLLRSWDDQEHLLYDFCVTESFYSPYFERTFEVFQIDSIELGETKRKRISFSNGDYEIGQYWIEGIGSNGGLLYPTTGAEIPLCTECCGGEQFLICYSFNDDLIYLNENYVDCDHAIVSIDESVSGLGINIYPNPNEGKFFISHEITGPSVNIEIVSVKGEILLRENNISNINYGFSINTPGIYIIKITSGQGVTTKKVVVRDAD